MSDERRYLIVAYDVSELSEDEIDVLAGEAQVQAERSDGHPNVGVVSGVISAERVGILPDYVGIFATDGVEIHALAHPSSVPVLDLSAAPETEVS